MKQTGTMVLSLQMHFDLVDGKPSVIAPWMDEVYVGSSWYDCYTESLRQRVQPR